MAYETVPALGETANNPLSYNTDMAVRKSPEAHRKGIYLLIPAHAQDGQRSFGDFSKNTRTGWHHFSPCPPSRYLDTYGNEHRHWPPSFAKSTPHPAPTFSFRLVPPNLPHL